LGYLGRGNACALNIFMHKQYPFNNLDENNLAHVGKAMHYPFKLENICYGAQCIYEKTYEGY